MWKVFAQIGLGLAFVGAGLLALASRILIQGSGAWGGGITPEAVKNAKWPGRMGWLLILLGLALQSVAVWLA